MKSQTNIKTKKQKASKAAFADSPWHITSFLRSIDRFGQSIPTFNIKGENEVKTTIGGVLTAIVMILTLSYFITNL